MKHELDMDLLKMPHEQIEAKLVAKNENDLNYLRAPAPQEAYLIDGEDNPPIGDRQPVKPVPSGGVDAVELPLPK